MLASMIDVTHEGERTRYTFTHRSPLLGRLVGTVVLLAVLGVLGPGCLALGSQHLQLRCERASTRVECVVSEGFLFGLLPRVKTIADITAIDEQAVGDEGGTALVFVTAGGRVRLATVSTNLNHAEKRALKRRLAAFLETPGEPRLVTSSWLLNAFAVGGGLASLLWLFGLWALGTWPLRAVRPAFVEVDSVNRWVQLRRVAGRRTERFPFSAVQEITASPDLGGLVGRLQCASTRDPEAPPLPLHLALTLHDGRRLVIVNEVNSTTDEQRTCAAALAQALGPFTR